MSKVLNMNFQSKLPNAFLKSVLCIDNINHFLYKKANPCHNIIIIIVIINSKNTFKTNNYIKYRLNYSPKRFDITTAK